MLPHPVVIQHAGLSPISVPGVTCVDVLTRDAFCERMAQAELLVCHAGAGTILDALRAGTPIVVMARRPERGEIVDGHQLELAETLSRLGAVRAVEDAAALRSTLAAWKPRPQPLSDPFQQRNLSDRVHADIESLLRRGARPRIALVATTGGHMTELLELRKAYEHLPHFYVANDRMPVDAHADSVHVFPSSDHDWRVFRHVPAMLRMLLKERPGIILSTGAGSAIPVMLLARAIGAAVIYVESLTRVRQPSFTARVAYPISDSFIVRWPDIARRFPRASLSAAWPIPIGLAWQAGDGDLSESTVVLSDGQPTAGLPSADAGSTL